MDVLKEMMIDEIEKKVAEFKQQKETYEYNSYQLELILKNLKAGEELHPVEKNYLEIIFDWCFKKFDSFGVKVE